MDKSKRGIKHHRLIYDKSSKNNPLKSSPLLSGLICTETNGILKRDRRRRMDRKSDLRDISYIKDIKSVSEIPHLNQHFCTGHSLSFGDKSSSIYSDTHLLGNPSGRQDAENLQEWYLRNRFEKDFESTVHTCYKEITRQVSIQCIERGQILQMLFEDLKYICDHKWQSKENEIQNFHMKIKEKEEENKEIIEALELNHKIQHKIAEADKIKYKEKAKNYKMKFCISEQTYSRLRYKYKMLKDKYTKKEWKIKREVLPVKTNQEHCENKPQFKPIQLKDKGMQTFSKLRNTSTQTELDHTNNQQKSFIEQVLDEITIEPTFKEQGSQEELINNLTQEITEKLRNTDSNILMSISQGIINAVETLRTSPLDSFQSEHILDFMDVFSWNAGFNVGLEKGKEEGHKDGEVLGTEIGAIQGYVQAMHEIKDKPNTSSVQFSTLPNEEDINNVNEELSGVLNDSDKEIDDSYIDQNNNRPFKNVRKRKMTIQVNPEVHKRSINRKNTSKVLSRARKKIQFMTVIREFQFSNKEASPKKKNDVGNKKFDSILKKPLKSITQKANMSRKMILKTISNLYSSKVNGENFIHEVHEEFVNKYGLKTVSDKKFVDFLGSLYCNASSKRVLTFIKLIGGAHKINESNYSTHSLKFALNLWKSMLNSKTGTMINFDESADSIPFPLARALECAKESLEHLVSKTEYFELCASLEQAAVPDLKRVNTVGLVEIDFMMEKCIEAFEKYQESIEQGVKRALEIAGEEGKLERVEFELLVKHLSPLKLNAVKEDLGFESEDGFVCFDTLVSKCVEHNCLSMTDINDYQFGVLSHLELSSLMSSYRNNIEDIVCCLKENGLLIGDLINFKLQDLTSNLLDIDEYIANCRWAIYFGELNLLYNSLK